MEPALASGINGSLYRRLVETMRDGLAVLDREGRLAYVNPALGRLLGLSPEEVVGRPTVEFVAPCHQEAFREQFRTRRDGRADSYEIEIRGPDGIGIPVLVSPQPIFLETGEFDGSFAVVTDIRERRRSELEREVTLEIVRGVVVTANLEELLRLIHAALKRVIYAENCFVALWDEDSQAIRFPYFVDLHDEAPEQLPRGRTCTDFVLRTGQPLLLHEEVFRDLVDRGEIELYGSDSPSWMGVPLITPQRTIGVLAVQHYEDQDAYSERDLDFLAAVGSHIALAIQRRRTEDELHARRELYTNIVGSMSDGVMVIDRGFRVVYWNRAMEEISELPREQVLDSGLAPWELLPQMRPLGIDRLMRRAMRGQPQSASRLRHRLPSGIVRITSETYRPLRDADGGIRGVVGVVRDISERSRAEEAVRRSEERIQQAQKMEAIGGLASGIAHDFNNLLTAINGYSELILSGMPDADPIRPQVEEIRNAGEQAADLTRQLLAFSRRQVIRPRVVDLNALLRGLEPMLRRLVGEHVHLEIRTAPRLGLVRTDPGQIERVVINLALNARDAMPQGGDLVIRTGSRMLGPECTDPPGRSGEFVCLSFEDTGVGMDAQTRKRVFEPFFTTKEKGKGTGLGLATVYGIVKQNRGSVWLESRPGQGTTFWICLPRTREALQPEEPVGAPRPVGAGRGTILVVEDEEGVRTLTRAVLEQHGYVVLEADGPDRALALCGECESPPDLLLTDIVMPRMSGPRLAATLQKKTPGLKILFMSGHPDDTILQQGSLPPQTELLAKPFAVRDLLARVASALGAPPD